MASRIRWTDAEQAVLAHAAATLLRSPEFCRLEDYRQAHHLLMTIQRPLAAERRRNVVSFVELAPGLQALLRGAWTAAGKPVNLSSTITTFMSSGPVAELPERPILPTVQQGDLLAPTSAPEAASVPATTPAPPAVDLVAAVEAAVRKILAEQPKPAPLPPPEVKVVEVPSLVEVPTEAPVEKVLMGLTLNQVLHRLVDLVVGPAGVDWQKLGSAVRAVVAPTPPIKASVVFGSNLKPGSVRVAWPNLIKDQFASVQQQLPACVDLRDSLASDWEFCVLMRCATAHHAVYEAALKKAESRGRVAVVNGITAGVDAIMDHLRRREAGDAAAAEKLRAAQEVR